MVLKDAMNEFEEIKIGAKESFTKTIGEADLTLFCGYLETLILYMSMKCMPPKRFFKGE